MCELAENDEIKRLFFDLEQDIPEDDAIRRAKQLVSTLKVISAPRPTGCRRYVLDHLCRERCTHVICTDL